MAVRIRMKKLGRKHRPFFRICAMDKRSPRDGRVIEELGYYDPMVKEKDARAVLKADRVDYWLGVGAQPSQKCAVLIKKYGKDGTHLEAQQAALERLAIKPQAPEAVPIPLPTKEEPTPEPVEEASAAPEVATDETVTAEASAEGSAEAPAEEAAADAQPEAASAAPEEAKAEEPTAEATQDGGEEAAEKSE